MVTLTFEFLEEKVKTDGFTTDELLAPMRKHAKKYGIKEQSYGVFTQNGENAMCNIGMFVVEITKNNHAYISYLRSWLFDVDGEIEDCVITTKEIYENEGIKQLETMKNGD